VIWFALAMLLNWPAFAQSSLTTTFAGGGTAAVIVACTPMRFEFDRVCNAVVTQVVGP
jgi:glutamate/tyrosine decarboxylase-like PLP-dependent enzyme